jgi:hypothetical protein
LDELVVIYTNSITMWPLDKDGDKYGKVYEGRLILTNERLTFLSYRKNLGSGIFKITSDAPLPPPSNNGLYIADFDLSPLQNEGSFNAPLRDIVSYNMKENFLYGVIFVPEIRIGMRNFLGQEGSYLFMSTEKKGKKWSRKFMSELKEMKERFG